VINKILKIYTYKVLSNLFKKLDKIHKNKNISIYEDFFCKLYDINVQKSKYRFIKEQTLEGEPYLHQGIHFTIKQKPKREEKNNKTIIYRKLLPSFVNYLNRIFIDRKCEIFEKIKNNKKGDKFCDLFKKFVKKTHIPDKEDLVDSLKYYVYIKITKSTSSDKLYNLVRKAIIRKILNISKTTGNITRILNLVNITVTHRKIAKDRWLQNLIRRWRFIAFIKKMALKKLELMYKDLHVNYLEMADTLLSEGSPMGPYERRFLPDIKMDKYLFDFDDPLLIKGAKPYQGTKMKYIFKPIDAEIEKKYKVIQEVETIDRTREINRTYYTNDNKENINNKKFKGKNISKNNDNYNDNNDVHIEGKYYNDINNNIEIGYSSDNNIDNKEKIKVINDIRRKGNKNENITSEERYSYKREVKDDDNDENNIYNNENVRSSNKLEGRFSYKDKSKGKNANENEDDNIDKNSIKSSGRFERKGYVKTEGKKFSRFSVKNENEYEDNENEYEFGERLSGEGKYRFGRGKMYESVNIKSNNENDNNNINNSYIYSSKSSYRGPGYKRYKKEEKA
jgi:hypothetical protein